MACCKAKQKQTEGFLRVCGPQLRWLPEADGTQEGGGGWAVGSSPPSCVGFKNRAEEAFHVWMGKIPSPASLYYGVCRGEVRNHAPSCGLQDLSLIKPRARGPRIPGNVIKTTEGYLE